MNGKGMVGPAPIAASCLGRIPAVCNSNPMQTTNLSNELARVMALCKQTVTTLQKRTRF